ncbi:hypothetical protein CFOL_v3_12690, partial [Cephalotus follicularis]
EEPPSLKASSALCFSSLTLALIPCPSSSAMILLTVIFISSLPTIPFDGRIFDRTATPSSSVSSAAFNLCSAYSGHAIIGTPFVTLSSAEFHPQCDKNPPTDGWLKISTCGAQSRTTTPKPWVRIRNPSGRLLDKSSPPFPVMKKDPSPVLTVD